MRTDDLRISRVRPCLRRRSSPEEIPLTARAGDCVASARRTIEAILDGRDHRMLVIVGPCSILRPEGGHRRHAQRLRELAERVRDRVFIVMRVYFEKPLTVVGWKGLINDPDLDSSYHINKGLRLARQLLADIAEMGLPAGTEFLDTDIRQFYTDLVSWGAIGARAPPRARCTVSLFRAVDARGHQESHRRQRAGRRGSHSGGAGSGTCFLRLTKEGAPAILETTGNPYCHLVLRGGTR